MTDAERGNSPNADAALEGRVAVVTGAGGELGKAVVRWFAGRGARVALLGRDEERLAALAEELDLEEGCWVGPAADLSDPAETLAAAAAVLAALERVDILVHLVGGYRGGVPLAGTQPEELTEVLAQHVWTTANLARAFVPPLTANGWGRIVAASTPFGFNPPGKNAPYAAAKAAQQSLILSLAHELAGSGVTANAVLIRKIDVKRQRESDPSAANARWATPEEIAGVIGWLCSDAAGQVNGALIPVHGGPTPG